MQCLVLAAGDGTRMLPLTAMTAKPLLRIAGRPFLEHTLQVISGMGLEDVAILVGWQKNEVVSHFAGGDATARPRFIEQTQRLGTAHAIAQARDWVSGPFLCINGDVLPSGTTLSRLVEASRGNPDSVVMACARASDPSGYGIVELDGDGRVCGLVEKPERPASDLVNAGMYVFPEDVLDAIDATPMSPRGEYEITTTLEGLMQEGRLMGVVMDEPWVEVTYPWDMLATNSYLMAGLEGDVKGQVEEGVHMEGEVVVAEGARVRRGSYLVGPVIIDEGADVGPNCFIRPSTYIGKGCRVGNAVEVKNTILMDGSNIPHHNYVGDSVIMEDVNLGAGTKVANLRLDEGPVPSFSKGQRIGTGLRKLGTMIGPGAKLGINCSIDPGTVISEDVHIGPGRFVRGFVAPRARLF